eukprot:5563352-Amphidinium_carterae.1
MKHDTWDRKTRCRFTSETLSSQHLKELFLLCVVAAGCRRSPCNNRQVTSSSEGTRLDAVK